MTTSTLATALAFHWFLPTGGDGHAVGAVSAVQARSAESTRREPTVGYLGQVAAAAERSGFGAVLTPVGSACQDPWTLASALTQHTSDLDFLIAVRPGLAPPLLVAQQAATFQRFSGGRLRVNIVTGGDSVEQRAYGDFLDHGERYARTAEFLSVWHRLWAGETVDHDGRHLRIDRATLLDAPVPPPVYFGGASSAAEAVAARYADVHLSWGEPPEQLGGRVDRLRDLAATHGRSLRFGVRLHVIARSTSDEAWAEADRLLAAMTPEAIAAAQQRYALMDSVGQARMAALHGGRSDGLEIAPNLWAGIGLVREGAATALVGSYAEVAERIAEYHRIGFEEFVLSGYPHLEEAFRFGEFVRPEFDER